MGRRWKSRLRRAAWPFIAVFIGVMLGFVLPMLINR